MFVGKLRLEDTELENADYRALWLLLSVFGYVTKAGLSIQVPAGYITDFASIPRMFWRIEPPTGRVRRAAVIHDWLYALMLVSRDQADRIFLEAMEVCGVPYLKRHAMYLAVRAGGASGYGRPEEHQAALKLVGTRQGLGAATAHLAVAQWAGTVAPRAA